MEVTRIQVKVTSYSILREVFGSDSVLIEMEEGETVADLIAHLSSKFGRAFQEKTGRDLTQALRERFNLFLNRRIVKIPDELGLELSDKDELVILQPVGGG